MTDDHLQLVGGEEAAWTCESSVAEMEMVLVRCCELMFVYLVRASIAHLEVTESIKLMCSWYELWVRGDVVGGGAEMGANGELHSIGQGQRLAYNAVKPHWKAFDQ